MKLTQYLLVVLCGALIGFTFTASYYESQRAEVKEYDYIIDLDMDVIHVVTEYGVRHEVHHDSLDEFIIKDNL